MSAKIADLNGLPHWPRLLSMTQAAAYVGVSPGTFKKEVADGRWPQPERRGKRLLWDRALLDRTQDERSGLTTAPAATITSSDGGGEWAAWK